MTAPVEDVEAEIVEALADLIEALFDPAVFAVVGGALNPSPDLGAALNLSLSGDDARQSLRRYTLQVRTRAGADQREVGQIAERIAVELHGRRAIPAGASVIAHIWRISSVSLGRDDSRRWQRSDNYLIDVSTPGTEWIET
jgi:hypothetical protein